MNKLEVMQNKKILILGFAREGQDVLKFLRSRFFNKKIGIADQLLFSKLPKEARAAIKKHCKRSLCTFYFGKNYLSSIKEYDVIVKSPGISPLKIPALRKNQILTSETNLFFDMCPGKIIGITGTKGKSTTSKLIFEVLREKYPSSLLVGNIGKPALAQLPRINTKTLVVYELSSFQLADLNTSPHIAVVLNIFPEHLDWHGDFTRYVRAKSTIVKFQKKDDIVLYDVSNPIAKRIAQKSKAHKISFVCDANRSRKALPAFLNPKSVCAAYEIAKIFHISEKIVFKALRTFKGLPHRLAYVGTFRRIRFYNDSLATIPEATISAIQTLGPDVETLILGGFDRGISFTRLAKFLTSKTSVKTYILFFPSGIRMKKAIEHSKPGILHIGSRFLFVRDMKIAVKLAYQYTSPGKICLLSPSSPSFGIFKDYAERGTLFEKYIGLLSRR